MLCLIVPVITEPECRTDDDCASKLSCIGEKCQNPCRLKNPCEGNQICEVFDTSPIRTVTCSCPEGLLMTAQGSCQDGNYAIVLSSIGLS